jgi:transaldolase
LVASKAARPATEYAPAARHEPISTISGDFGTERTQGSNTMATQTDPLGQLSAAGVAVWLDDLSRERLRTGNLGDLIRDRHVVGITTNPTIFQKAISGADAYSAQLDDLTSRGVDVGEALRLITTADVRWGCDVLRPAYDASDTVDGRVSIEVDPRISADASKTIAEARSLWWMVDRPNLFIKIPATLGSLPAISQALAEGISVNVTLIFSLDRYAKVIDAFFDGLERARNAGVELAGIGSVASFFVSRVDTEVDARLDKIGSAEAIALKGKAAVANARLAYQLYEEKFASPRWASLAAAGAKVQRPLWASTGVKDPAYDDTMYVVDLVADHTVNTMPEPTLQAVYNHGVIAGDAIRGHYVDARAVLDQLAAVGVDYDDVVRTLEDEGVEKFEASWTDLIAAVQKKLDEKAGS